MKQFHALMGRAQWAVALSTLTQVSSLLVASALIIFGLVIVFAAIYTDFQRSVGLGMAIAGLVMLVILVYRDPLGHIRESIANLVKVNVILLGYMRQVNQVDAMFKQTLTSVGAPDAPPVEKTLEQLRDIMQYTMLRIEDFLETQ